MNWTNEPATEQQLSYLQHCGYVADHPLTRSDAADLIKHYREQAEHRVEPEGLQTAEDRQRGSYHLGMILEESSSAAPPADLAKSNPAPATLHERRKEFWLDTCREVTEMHSASPQTVELYKKYGCRFAVPSHDEVQEVLDALDSAMKIWEVEHSELFYQTLEINFPELVKHHV